MFLEVLISEKQNELSERRQMTELVAHLQHVTEASQSQTELLQNLIGRMFVATAVDLFYCKLYLFSVSFYEKVMIMHN